MKKLPIPKLIKKAEKWTKEYRAEYMRQYGVKKQGRQQGRKQGRPRGDSSWRAGVNADFRTGMYSIKYLAEKYNKSYGAVTQAIKIYV